MDQNEVRTRLQAVLSPLSAFAKAYGHSLNVQSQKLNLTAEQRVLVEDILLSVKRIELAIKSLVG